jgi:signal transduction histidine kinase
MDKLTGIGLAARRAREEARRARPGLVQVLVGRDAAPGWWSQPWQRRAYSALILATLALSLANLASARTSVSVAALSAAPLAAAPLLLAARYPLLGWRIGWLALLFVPLTPNTWWGGWPWGPVQLVVVLLLFGVAGLRYGRSVLWWMWALSLIPWWLWLANDLTDLGGPVGATIVFTAATIALDSIGAELRTHRALIAQTERTASEQARTSVLQERARIARELHDVVAHHMSLIAVRAETAPYRLGSLPEPALAEFSSISGAARDALAEMRRLLGVLRQDQEPERAPQPQLTDLPTLIETARLAGVTVQLSAPAPLDQVPSGVALCAYRIVQESLSNASRHAPGAAVDVSVDHDVGTVLLRVANGPADPLATRPAEGGTGHGLTGMRERVALLGGTLLAGPAPDGGFVVSAVLPVGGTA